ncbi:MAG: hypothetical protein ACKVKH_00340 [Verrucomicrobiales bacterium]
MSVPKIMALRMGVYCVLVGYLVCDFFVFKGPVYKSLNSSPRDEKTMIAEAKASGVVARVYYRPIYRAQVEEAMKEYLWRRGRNPGDTSAPERRLLRELMVNQLIDEELIKLQIKVSMSEEVAVSDDKVARAGEIEKGRHPDSRVYDELARRAGWSGEKEREMRLAARIQREEYIEKMLAVKVSDEEAKSWFEGNAPDFPAGFEVSRESIKDALSLKKRDEAWKKFRYEKLRHRAEGKIDLFDDVLFAEERD